MTNCEHGGDWAGFEREFGVSPLDFSANVSPLGLPEGVKAAAIQALVTADRYPDPLCRALREAIAVHENVPAEFCLCGNGAADLIFRAVQAIRPKRALLTAPTFAEYGAALDSVGCEIVRWELREADEFQLNDNILNAITPDIDMVFLCEPNNPTGITTDPALLERICDRCKQADTWLVLDECFLDFVDEPEKHTKKHRLADMPKLLLLRSFTKMYAMAGLRLGYCLSANTALLEAMRVSGAPWTVSGVAQAAGIAALQETEYVRRVRTLTAHERERMKEALRALGLTVIPGEANYLLFRGPRGLVEKLRQRGILLRGCGNFAGLDDTWYRTAIRTAKENERFLTTLREVLT